MTIFAALKLPLACILYYASFAKSETATADDCPITCLNGSVCTRGEQNATGHPVGPDGLPFDFHSGLEISRDGWHCKCPPGLTGLRCGRPFESCGVDNHVCYHGGSCISGLEDVYGNAHYFCNCSGAILENDEGTMKRYRGKFCEEEVDVVSRCDDTKNYCLNGGSCKSRVAVEAQQADPCECQEGYFGRNCEYVKGTVPDCTLPCENGAACRLGVKGFDQILQEGGNVLDADPQTFQYQYCECPPGFHGALCDKTSEMCDGHTCFNGASCVEIENSQGDTESVCNCLTGNTDYEKFAGRECQYVSTTFCSHPTDPNGRQFCVNDGRCPSNPHEDCHCPEGYFGPRCEFRQDDEADREYTKCNTQCLNGGACKKGPKELADSYKDIKELQSVLQDGGEITLEHCACPKGFIGENCEHKVEECGEGEHLCLHGSSCVKYGEEYQCLCEQAKLDGKPTAGKYCENKATDMCESSTIDIPVNPRKAHRGFCTNGGSCITNTEKGAVVYSCECPESHQGPHCEYPKGSVNLNNEESTGQPKKLKHNSGAVFGIVLTVLLMIAIAGMVWRAKKRAKNHKVQEPYVLSPRIKKADTMTPISPAHSEEVDESELTEVEIL